MKIVMINGQNHEGSTYHIAKILVEQLGSEHDVKTFFLPRDLNHFCMGCCACIDDETKCPYFKEKQVIEVAMKEADLLILTTPNYCMAPSAPMKAFIDLFFQFWIPHRPRPEMFSKKAVVISTAAGIGMSKAMKPVKRTLAYWGVPDIKTYGISVQASNWSEVSEKKKNQINKNMKSLANKIKHSKQKKPSLYIQGLFYMMAASRSKADDHSSETAYWKHHGWLDKQKPWKK